MEDELRLRFIISGEEDTSETKAGGGGNKTNVGIPSTKLLLGGVFFVQLLVLLLFGSIYLSS